MVKLIQVHLTVQSLEGTFEGDFDADQKLQEVLDKAFIDLDIKPAPGDTWELQYDGRCLDLQTTIEEQDIPDGATLALAPDEGGGGR